jgi:hypothetical protein
MDMFEELNKIGLPKLNLLDSSVFLHNLLFNYDLMVASETLVEEAINKLDKPTTEFERELKEYYINHLEEERGHEKWLKEDLEGYGASVEGVSYIAAACAGMQYYLIKHSHPVALLGYMAVLEGYPMENKNLELLESKYGKELLRTIRYHALHDVEHKKDLVKILTKVPRELETLVLNSGIQTLKFFYAALSVS